MDACVRESLPFAEPSAGNAFCVVQIEGQIHSCRIIGFPVSRPLVGGIALACLVAAAGIALLDTWESMWCAAFVRVGLLMGAFWLALPNRHREAAWANLSPYTAGGAVLAIFAVARGWRVAAPVIIAIVVIGLMLRPKTPKRPRG